MSPPGSRRLAALAHNEELTLTLNGHTPLETILLRPPTGVLPISHGTNPEAMLVITAGSQEALVIGAHREPDALTRQPQYTYGRRMSTVSLSTDLPLRPLCHTVYPPLSADILYIDAL